MKPLVNKARVIRRMKIYFCESPFSADFWAKIALRREP